MSISWMQEGGRPPEFIKDVSEQLGEGGALLIGGPSWVRTPPELGAKKMNITKQGWVDMRCPVCDAGGPIYTMQLEEGVHVACCQSCEQYGWFRGDDVPAEE